MIPLPSLHLDLGAGIRLPLHRIEPGSFLMGSRGYDPSEEPQHPVTIGQPFFLGTYPVTQEQFAQFAAAKLPEPHQNHFSGEANLPAENVTWFEAVAFCEWLNEAFPDQIPAGFRAALPDEERWEFACRAGSRTEYANGDGQAALEEMGWFEENSGKRTHPVGGKKPNPWGLYHCHGNVFEWMSDLWNPDAYRDEPQQAPASAPAGEDPLRVIRGGSWNDAAGDCRSARRIGDWPGSRNPVRGFRVCLVPGP